MTYTIVVVGVTGIQGSSVAKTFLKTPGWAVQGITRDPSKDAAVALAKLGVNIVRADLDDKASLVPAFIGATAIFSNTDYFGHLWQGASNPSVLGGRTPNQYAYEREIQQGLHIAEAANNAAVLKTLKQFIYSSLSETRKWSKGKYLKSYHNDSKAETIQRTELEFPEVASRMRMLEVGHYVTNWQLSPPLRPRKLDDGTYLFRTPLPSDYVVPFVWPHEDTGEFVKALLDMPAGTTLTGASEGITWSQWAETWARVLKVKAKYVQVGVDEFFDGHGVPEVFAEEFRDTWAYVQEFGYDGGNPDCLTPDQLDFKVPTKSVEEYIRSEDWSSVL